MEDCRRGVGLGRNNGMAVVQGEGEMRDFLVE